MLFRPAHVLRLGIPAALVAATLITVTGSSGQAAQPEPKQRKFSTGIQATPAYEPNSVVVKFRDKATTTARKQALSKHAGKAATSVTSDVVEVTGSVPAPDLLKKLKAEPSVELASLNYTRKASAVPNDDAYAQGVQRYLSTVRMPQAWDLSKTAGSQTVAVLDTGVDAGHPDLVGRTVPGYNTINPGTTPNDDNFHGTFVSGIIAANTSNTEGIAGVAWNAKVMPVKVLDRDGSGSDADIVTGINWAVTHGARVINLSLGGPGDDPVLRDAVANAVSQGVVVVVSAGNSGDDVPQYPAAYPEALTVGATNDNAVTTSFSSHADWVDISAPGYNIVSTGPRFLDPSFPYWQGSGTSFSAPIVSGVAALVRNKYPTLTAAQVVARLKATARDAGPRGIDPYYGAGILDAYAALGGSWAADFAQAAADGNDFPARATPLTGSSISAAIGAEGDVDWYKVDSAAARNVTVKVSGPLYDSVEFAQNFGPVVSVYDQNFQQIGSAEKPRPDEDADGYEIPGIQSASTNVSLPAGAAYISVRNYNGSRDSRQYTLTVNPSGVGGPGASEPRLLVKDASVPDFSVNVAQNVAPSITFTQDLAPATVTTDTVRLYNGKTGAAVPVTPSYDAATNKVTLTPTSPLVEATAYRIRLSGVQNPAGATIAPFTTTFRTVDLVPPVAGTFDATGAYLAATLSWKIPAIPDFDQVIVRRNVGSKPPTSTTGTLVYAGTGTTVKNTGLLQGTTYTFAAWVKDRSGKVSPVATTQLLGMKSAISTNGSLINYGGAITLKGSVIRIDNLAYAGLPVAVYVRPKNVSTFKLLTTLKTGTTGSVSYAYKPAVSSVFAMAFLGNGDLMGTRTANITVEVKPIVSATLAPAAIKLGATTRLSGTVNPAHSARLVYLQQYGNKVWTTIASVKQTSTGYYAFGIKPKARGLVAYRVVFTADADHAQSISANKTLSVS
ncbi:S8 family serine peptidase [Kribbella sp. VKM Ac-2568]|uniref:S8 family serine peptidase n=1 Tax=Kribbella sp. VKM Ac-2568 TaxID=2512219 RepID=UPI0010448019|nr:S8 family serine peptidase [Kribbella sp. VKM Ac-2568]TCM44450.1 type VII secretion-associated serine protease mycosin [Kribbella sp. VKM Ac-2568]